MWIWPVGILAAAAAIAWQVARRFHRRNRAADQEVRSSPVPKTAPMELPPVLRAFVERAVPGGPPPAWTRIREAGAMCLRPGGPWLPFVAEQVFAVGKPAFVWSARFRAFRVIDALVDGSGRLEARLLGVVPVARSEGCDATRAQLARYLAEIVWVPAAIAFNPAITWREMGEREVVGTATLGQASSELTFTFDGDGDIVRVAGERERQVRGGSEPTHWVGTFCEYRELGGARIPTRAEVQWVVAGEPFPYWRGSVTAWESGCIMSP